MILVIDNYDSFVHNLARYVREAGHQTVVIRNDEKPAAELIDMSPDAVILSPGPKAPNEAGVCAELLGCLDETIPMLGVCLGHQCLVEQMGGTTERAMRPLHGQASKISHNGERLFKGIENPMRAGRYHSLISVLAENGSLDACAWSEEGELMAVQHRVAPWFGVQFHPESLLTPEGRKLLANFLGRL